MVGGGGASDVTMEIPIVTGHYQNNVCCLIFAYLHFCSFPIGYLHWIYFAGFWSYVIGNHTSLWFYFRAFCLPVK